MGTAMIYISLYSAESMRKNLKSLISKNAKRGFSDVRFCFPERFFQYENKETFANEAIIGKIQKQFRLLEIASKQNVALACERKNVTELMIK